MGRPYKDVGEKYAYQIELEAERYVLEQAFTFSDIKYVESIMGEPYPEEEGWPERRWIKRFAEKIGYKRFKIARAKGYCRDLHGDYVYELWVDKYEEYMRSADDRKHCVYTLLPKTN